MSDAHARKESAALASIGASAAIAVGKLVAGLMSGSLALLSEAGHALVDTGATILTWLAVRASGKPADEEHHYGHGKYEPLAALVETGLLFALTAFVVFEAVRRLSTHDDDVEPKLIAFAVLGASIVIDLVRWRSLSKIARETKSEALAADALHFSSDLVASVLVLIGLTITWLGYPQADAYAAFGVALFVGIAGSNRGLTLCYTSPAVPTCGATNGFYPGTMIGLLGPYGVSRFLDDINTSGRREGRYIYSVWSTADEVIGGGDLVWGRFTSQIPGQDGELRLSGIPYGHMNSKNLTVEQQLRMIRDHQP